MSRPFCEYFSRTIVREPNTTPNETSEMNVDEEIASVTDYMQFAQIGNLPESSLTGPTLNENRVEASAGEYCLFPAKASTPVRNFIGEGAWNLFRENPQTEVCTPIYRTKWLTVV